MSETNSITFADLGLSAETLEALAKKGYTTPTPIQAQTIPLLLQGAKDIIAMAQTGTGKTAAFGLPIIEKVVPGKRKVQALILAPTRELAVQVTEEIVSFKGKKNLYILPVYGGQGMDYQLRRLQDGVDIVVGTPGRIIDHLKRGTLNLSETKFVVLDEADEMLNMGFAEEVEEILKFVPQDKQMLLFSATMPDRIRVIAENYMGKYEMVRAPKTEMAAPKIEQTFYEVYPEDKLNALCRIIDTAKEFYSLIFCKTKSGTDELANQLIEKGYAVEALHGDVSQNQREVIMKKFKKRRSTILVATDVAARGIDVNDLSHVVNYDIPGDAETYTHRIGRTGRAGKKGVAITLIAPREFRRLQEIRSITRMDIQRGRIPTVEQAIEQKKHAMLEELSARIAHENYGEFAETAQNLLEFNEPQWVISALLKKIYGDQLKPEEYTEIREPLRKKPEEKRTTTSRYERDDRNRGGYGDREKRYKDQKDIKKDDGFKKSFDKWDKERRDKKEFVPAKAEKKTSSKGGYDVLYFGRGSKDGVTTSMLKEFLKDETGIASHKIYEIDIFPRFSLFKVVAADADGILSRFRTPKGGDKPLVRRDRNN